MTRAATKDSAEVVANEQEGGAILPGSTPPPTGGTRKIDAPAPASVPRSRFLPSTSGPGPDFLDTTDIPAVSRQKHEAVGRSLPRRVSGRLKVAIDLMVMEALPRREAAARAKLSEHAIYCGLRKPHVATYYNSLLESVRLSERPRNLRRLIEIRDAAENLPAIHAIKLLEPQPDASNVNVNLTLQAGYVISLEERDEDRRPVINVTPRKDLPHV